MIYLNDNLGLATFAEDHIDNLKPGSRLTMTITREKSGGFSVATATSVSSEDIAEAQELLRATFFSETQVNT
jgi:hypothetical protein